ncbi:N-acetyl-gamma-glutamyl-phosphate reductase [Candidatus Pantoea carbekii]|uniref:N-acetyl-gamma-glutamyl-phosphate reductase n=1 Tax=Candidatus Pantoea carbekii TaxID=1235990 RepID=U3U753_9GAMM|nr:N-acetyl-gamma-glutamyl-phosphate reductase [Candidatus Pantoea carbekii]AKC32362.1 N-acetyl-gamma-glutamyl-phosphate reductase ArgC [Candidatus Pantoea carbekii]BAO00084.1 ArgC protein [Candidatus Pantoea carbekii]
MLNILIIGASGYVGVELVLYLNRHPHINIKALLVSEHSSDCGKLLSDLYPKLKGIVNLPLFSLEDISTWTDDIDVVFLATDHKVSHHLAPQFLKKNCIVFDLSGAFRVNDINFYIKYYGFSHQYQDWLNRAVYGLAEWLHGKINDVQLIAIPGCYPTVSQLALKPLVEASLLNNTQYPVINAISGVSGSGRKASINNHLCEVSLQPYGIFNHRHHLEIVTHLGIPVIFIPHLGNFSRGILATVTCYLKEGITYQDVSNAFHNAYDGKPLVRIYDKEVPALKSVVGLPFCDIGFVLQNRHLIIVAAEDNLLKGAASQAIQCLNIRFGFPETLSLI